MFLFYTDHDECIWVPGRIEKKAIRLYALAWLYDRLAESPGLASALDQMQEEIEELHKELKSWFAKNGS